MSQSTYYHDCQSYALPLPMLVDDGATDDSGGVPFSLVVACGGDLARYRQSLVVGQPPPESGCDVVVEEMFGCPAVHNLSLIHI